MALASESSGTQSCTLDTEHSLATPSTGKTRVLALDLNAMANGDVLIVRIKAKVGSGGTERVAYQVTYAHAQAEPTVFSIPVPMLYGGTLTIEQTDGTGRSIPWQVITLD